MLKEGLLRLLGLQLYPGLDPRTHNLIAVRIKAYVQLTPGPLISPYFMLDLAPLSLTINLQPGAVDNQSNWLQELSLGGPVQSAQTRRPTR
ncbi:MAG: hypothetical protein V7776_22685 [Halopseudomonas aestusnigri]